MNKTQAEAWVAEITKLLTGKTLIAIGHTCTGLHIRQNEVFDKAYFVEHGETCSVAVYTSYGVMTGSQIWQVKPDERAVCCEIQDPDCRYLWAIVEPDDKGELWQYMNKMQKRLWKVK